MYRDSAGNSGAGLTRSEHVFSLIRKLPVSQSHETDRCSGWDMDVMLHMTCSYVYQHSWEVGCTSGMGYASFCSVLESTVMAQNRSDTCTAPEVMFTLKNT